MASEYAFKDAQELLEGARRSRLDMPHFRHDAGSPGEIASLARLSFVHLPELSRRMGANIKEEEGHPPSVTVKDEGLVRLIAADVVASRPMANWLASHVSPPTAAMFAKGGENAIEGMLDRFAEERGFKRDDALTQEARGPSRGAAIAAALGADQGRGR